MRCTCEKCQRFYLNNPILSPPLQSTFVKGPWQCPGCKTFYSPDVNKCECQRVTSIALDTIYCEWTVEPDSILSDVTLFYTSCMESYDKTYEYVTANTPCPACGKPVRYMSIG